MARRKTHPAYQSDSPKLEVSSLIDICFLLLIYFLATSTLIPHENDLHMKLPRPNTDADTRMKITTMFIGIDSEGAIYVGTGSGRQMFDTDMANRSLPLLTDRLDLYTSAMRSANEIPLVQIHADGEAKQQRVIDVLNALAKAKISDVTFTDLIEM